MSADNGIYILKTPTTNSLVGSGNVEYEYRVVEAQSIEDIYYNDGVHFFNGFNVEYLIDKFKDAQKFDSDIESWRLAQDMYEACYICEYGINTLEGEMPWDFYQEMYDETVLGIDAEISVPDPDRMAKVMDADPTQPFVAMTKEEVSEYLEEKSMCDNCNLVGQILAKNSADENELVRPKAPEAFFVYRRGSDMVVGGPYKNYETAADEAARMAKTYLGSKFIVLIPFAEFEIPLGDLKITEFGGHV